MPLVSAFSARVAPQNPSPVPNVAGSDIGRTHSRLIRDIAFRKVVIIELMVGEYRAACDCCKTFRSDTCTRRAVPLFTLRDSDKPSGFFGVELEDLDGFRAALGIHLGQQVDDRVPRGR